MVESNSNRVLAGPSVFKAVPGTVLDNLPNFVVMEGIEPPSRSPNEK